jgi:hypothetical protein
LLNYFLIKERRKDDRKGEMNHGRQNIGEIAYEK